MMYSGCPLSFVSNPALHRHRITRLVSSSVSPAISKSSTTTAINVSFPFLTLLYRHGSVDSMTSPANDSTVATYACSKDNLLVVAK